jgi:hypothetical protein
MWKRVSLFVVFIHEISVARRTSLVCPNANNFLACWWHDLTQPALFRRGELQIVST